MSKIEASGFTEQEPRGAPDHPIFAADWQDRVTEARAKREKLLAARNKDTSAVTPSEATDEDPETTQEEETQVVRNGLLSRLTAADLRMPIFVFAGAAGLGLGVTLGVGILIGIGTPLEEPQTQAAVAVPSQTMEYSEMPAVEAPVETLVPTEIVAAKLADFPDLPDVPQSFFAPQPGTSAAINLPEISAVQYMRADTDLAIAAALRSLPVAPGAEDMDYGGSGAENLQFFIHAPDGIPNATLQGYVAALDDAGIDVAEIGRESFRVSATHLRYYSPETAAVAEAVARDLGVEARDFSENAQNAERIEVWVAGRPKPSDDVEEPRSGFFARLFNPQRQDAE